jgi:hypothetical protein
MTQPRRYQRPTWWKRMCDRLDCETWELLMLTIGLSYVGALVVLTVTR